MLTPAPRETAPTLDPHLAAIPFDTIRTPGSYVCNWNGFLLRVPPDAMGPDGGRALNIVGAEPLFVTKISDDPDLPLPRARAFATQHRLRVNF